MACHPLLLFLPRDPSLHSGFRLAAQTPPKRLKFESLRARHIKSLVNDHLDDLEGWPRCTFLCALCPNYAVCVTSDGSAQCAFQMCCRHSASYASWCSLKKSPRRYQKLNLLKLLQMHAEMMFQWASQQGGSCLACQKGTMGPRASMSRTGTPSISLGSCSAVWLVIPATKMTNTRRRLSSHRPIPIP
jgi:hypothetical protein